MVWMIDKATGETIDVADNSVPEQLRLGLVEFPRDGGDVAVRHYRALEDGSRDPEDKEGYIKLYDPEQAAWRIVNEKNQDFVGPKAAYEHHVQKKYGTPGYTGAAAALGVADSLSFGAISGIGETVGLPTREIIAANPGAHFAADMLTTGAAIIATGGAAAPGKFLEKAGYNSLRNLAKKMPNYGAHSLSALVGSKAEKSIAAKILGDSSHLVGNESLARAASSGLFSRVGAIGAESLLQSTGYSISDNLAELVHGDPERAMENIGQSIGYGTMFGLAIPAVLSGGLMTGAAGLRGMKRGYSAVVDYAGNSKHADKFLDELAEEAEDLGTLYDKNNPQDRYYTKEAYREVLQEARLGKEAKEAHQKIVNSEERMTNELMAHLDDAFVLNSTIRKIDQQGFSDDTVKKSLEYNLALPVSSDPMAPKYVNKGGASSPVLAHQLLSGAVDRGEKHVRYGLIDVLLDQLDRIPPGDGIPLTIKPEIDDLRNMLQAVKNDAAEWAHQHADEVISRHKAVSGRHPGGPGTLYYKPPRSIANLDAANVRGVSGSAHRTAKALASDMDFVDALDIDFNAKVYKQLEMISSRVHTGMIQGRFQKFNEGQQRFINDFKNELTDFLTGQKAWEVGPAQFSGFYPLGDPLSPQSLAGRKIRVNAKLSLRDGSWKEIKKNFGETDTDGTFAATAKVRPSRKRVGKFIHGINRINHKSNLELLQSYIRHSKDVLKHARDDFRPHPDLPSDWAHLAHGRAEALESTTLAHLDKIQTELEPALRYADIVKREHFQMNSEDYIGALMPGKASAAAIATGAIMGGFPGAAAGFAMARAPGVAKTRMALTPMKSAIRLQNMYVTLQNKNEKSRKWLRDYIRSKGRAPFIAEATGGGSISRWPRLFTANAIARTVTGQNETKYRHAVGGDPSKSYGRQEFKNTKAVISAMAAGSELREKLIEEISTNIGDYAPFLEPLVKQGLNSYLDAVAKALPASVNVDMFSEEIEPSDSEIQEFSEKLAVHSGGDVAIFRSLAAGDLSYNEWDTYEEAYPKSASETRKIIMEEMASLTPEERSQLPQAVKDQLAMVMGFDRVSPQVKQYLRGTFAPEQEGKPGPQAAPRWKEGRFPASQLSGTRAVEHRRA